MTGSSQRPSNNVGYTVVLPPQPSGQLPRWGAKNVLPLNLIAFPRGECCDTRIPSSKERRRSRPCEPIRSPSTVIPSEAEGSFLHCRHMHTCALVQTTPWCFLFRLSLAHDLPLCKKDPSTSALMTRKKDGLSHIVFHIAAVPLRGTLSCAFGAGRLASQEGALMGRLGASLD